MRSQWFTSGACWIGIAALMLTTVAVTHGQEKGEADKTKKRPLAITAEVKVAPGVNAEIVVLQGDKKVKVGDAVAFILGGDATSGAWMIGVSCHPANPTLRVQLGLGDAPAVVVDSVAPEGPAAKAGVRQHDLIVEAGGKKVGQLIELSAAVQNVNGGKLTLKLIRGGKQQTVEMTPIKRKHTQLRLEAWPHGDDVGVWLQKHGVKDFSLLRPGQFRFHGVHPFGVIDVKTNPFPKNLYLKIEKNGDKPAKIVVKRDGKQWETTEDKLDKLPKDIRRHVKRMLGQADILQMERTTLNAFDLHGRLIPPRIGIKPPVAPKVKIELTPHALPHAIGGGAAGKRVEKQLEAMNKRLDRLYKAIEQLQQPKGDRKPKAE